MMHSSYRPPAPDAAKPLASLLRVVLKGERDLLSLVPDAAYHEVVTPLGYSRRSILLVNAPDLIPAILANTDGLFPKNDLMVSALEELVGHSVFVSDGAQWRRQRRMIEPAFSHMRVGAAFPAMALAVGEAEERLDALAMSSEPFSLDAAMSFLTADIICRTIFSRPLEGGVGREVFEAFAVFEQQVASVDLGRLILGKPFANVRQPAHVRAACRTIRDHLGRFLTERAADGPDDIASAMMAARDPETGKAFTREELIDQIGVFFLAGHETTASALTWTFFILAQQPAVAARMRAEIDEVAGAGEIGFEQTKRLVFTRNVFREALRLYPPITFLPRVALADT
ncbi:MAG: cytochrome P450, partial [Beijerinckiaceae bacterium]